MKLSALFTFSVSAAQVIAFDNTRYDNVSCWLSCNDVKPHGLRTQVAVYVVNYFRASFSSCPSPIRDKTLTVLFIKPKNTSILLQRRYSHVI